MLKEQDIFVRSHLSPLKPEQVALMRARWERDKRKQKDAPAPPKRRRAAATTGTGASTARGRWGGGGAPSRVRSPRAQRPRISATSTCSSGQPWLRPKLSTPS